MIKRAQNVAQAVVRTRSSISSWSCMGPRRRTVGSLPNSKEEDSPETTLITAITPESPVSEVTDRNPEENNTEYCSPRSRLGQDDTDEEDELISVERVVTTSKMEEITEGQLWYELEMEILEREKNGAHEEEEAAAKEITEEEKELVADTVDSKISNCPMDVTENHYLYPPGRIMHMVSVLDVETNSGGDGPTEEHVGVYGTPRDLYSKIRLSKTMINDHYMPMYKKMMDLLIRELENDNDRGSVI